ncbi:MAG: hypothetical protein JWO35_537 [Candidatus Saccharibacteria bacterium]|nr:hypothetical protein [Candidatus Saccharibacteria bacterium]
MSNLEISSTEAKQDKLFYVVANIIIVNSVDQTCLLLKRSETEKVLGGKWAFPGGKLEHSDVASLLAETGNQPIDGIDDILGKLAVREAQEECGLTVNGENNTVIKNKVFVRPDGVPVFMATLTAEYAGGSVVLEDGAFSDFAWVSKENLGNYDCIEGVRQEAEKALS